MKNILVVDDHPLIIKGVKDIIIENSNEFIIYEASCSAEAMSIIKTENIDLIFMDIDLKGENGIELSKIILKDFPEIKIIILSFHNEYFFIRKALDAGLHGYLTKDIIYPEITVALRKALEGKIYLSDEAIKGLSGTEGINIDNLNKLTNHELQIFKKIAHGRTLKNIGKEMNLSDKTISVHKKNIMKKLGVKNISELIIYAIKSGLIIFTFFIQNLGNFY